MEKTQKPKLLADIPKVDIIITTGKSDEEFIKVIEIIRKKIIELRDNLNFNENQ